MSDILEDSRFAKYVSDPRYRQIPKHKHKVKIDKRFKSMFNDEKFKVKYTVDKRGRPINDTSTENLRKYYELASGPSDEDEVNSEDNQHKTLKNEEAQEVQGRFVKRPNDRDDIESEEEEEKSSKLNNDKLIHGKLDNKTKDRLHDLDIDYARGEGLLQTDSSSDEESSEAEEESELEHEWGELDADAETTEQSSRRFALCNMDWDNIKASDIMVLLSSFVPAGGVIHKVTIYPSEYGLKRIQQEELQGPAELTENKRDGADLSDDQNEEGPSYHMEKLRRYQLNRLKYYYAVVECDTVATADKLYSECDGMEYESSSTKLDLRFIPDDVSFDQEPREVCTKLPDLTKYQPRLFTTTALQQAKVELTWDTTNPNRTDAIRKAFTGNIDDLNINEYLASSTDDESEDDKDTGENKEQALGQVDSILKYKNLLKDIQEKEDKKKNKDMEMEITWGLGVKEKAEELVQKKLTEKGNKTMTPFEKIVEKRKEKKKQKKMERQKNLTKERNTDSDNEQHLSDEIPSDIDMNDSYFAEEFDKPEFKKVKDKTKRKEKKDIDVDKEQEKRNAELELLLDDETDGKAHFSLKKIQETESGSKKSKRKKKLKQKMINQNQSDNFNINLEDKRFSALYNSHLYNIDPTDPNFKKTKNMEKLIEEKLRRRPNETLVEEQVPAKKSREDAELSILIKNIKRKAKK